MGGKSNIDQDWGWIHAGVDRFAVLYDMWTWEATLLENKRQVSSPRNKTSIKHSYNAQYIYIFKPSGSFRAAQIK